MIARIWRGRTPAGKAESITPYFPSTGTGQINIEFPVG